MAKKKSAGGPMVVDNTVPVPTALEQELEQLSEWEAIAADRSLGFFDLMRALPDSAWDELMIYLYRLEPAISNKAGEKSYIRKYGSAIDEATVQAQFGGGKYLAYLKRDNVTVREHKFSIDGPAIIQDGQTLKGTTVGPVIVPGGTGDDGISRIVSEVIKATKGDPTAANAGIEIMKKGMLDTLDIQKSMTIAQAGSPTGNSIADKLLNKALERMDAPAAGSSMTETLQMVREIIKIARPETSSTPNPGPPVDQFALVKEVLGVDSLRELIDLGGGGKAQPWWVSLLTGVVDKLPMMLTEFSRMQQQGFERALIAHQYSAAGRVIPGTILPPASPGAPGTAAGTPPTIFPFTQSATPTPAGAPGSVPAGQIPQQIIQHVVESICRAYDEGYPGDFAAAHLRLSYPAVIDALRPLLASSEQLSEFVAQVPELADRARESEWAEFQQEFVQESMRDEMMPPAPPPPMTPVEPIFPNAADVAGTTSAPPRKPAASKKKVNGHGAA